MAKLTENERALLKALKQAEAWMAEVVDACEDDASTTLLPQEYPLTLKRVRAAIRRAEAQS